MKLTTRLLLGSLLVVAALVVFVIAVIDRRLHTRIQEETERQLAREARLVAIEWAAPTVPDALADAAGEALGHRVTLIAPGGEVLGDSEFDGAALDALQNHRTRPEVADALRTGMGSSRRLSPSAGDEELYVAVRTPLGVARVSLATRSVDEIFDIARRDVFLAGFAALLAAAGLAALFSRAVSTPIVELRDVAQALAAGELTRRPVLSAPGEVGDLAVALYQLAEQLGARLSALEAEESLLSALFDSLNEGVLAVDSRQQVVRINEAGRRLLHLSAPVPFPTDQLPHDRTVRAALSDALGGKPTPPVELSLYGRIVALTSRPLADGGAVLAALDLTSARRLENVRRDFVANVSHELRTPLTVIGGFAETLVEDELDPERRRRFADTIRVNAVRMQRIVDDLLDLSRIESGGWVPNPVWVDVGGVATDTLLPVHEAADRKGVALGVELHPGARTVFADPTAIRQVLANLVENAVRHTPAGAVTVVTRPDAVGAWVGVRDTGVGIPAEHLPRIFERFYRADASRSREAGGTGLGLAIVKHLAEAHGGTVEATSTVGAGTTILAFFPGPRVTPS
jgi:signal transduction histidine kinase